MTRLSKAYAAFLLAGAAAFVGPEALPRPARGFGRAGLARTQRTVIAQWDAVEKRLASGKPGPGDDSLQLQLEPRIADLAREMWIRDGQTAALLLMGLVSIGFAIASAPGAIRLRLDLPASGMVEVIFPETVVVDPAALEAEKAKLAASRRDAIAKLAPARHRCAYCGKRTHWEVLGRVGKRTLMKAPPAGVRDQRVKLAQGWWWKGLPPAPCRKCGSTDVVAA